MLKIQVRGPITRIVLARTVFGRPLYAVAAYLVDGLLIDTGCPATATELLRFCRGERIGQVINTHQHEDHCGGNAALQRELGLPIAAPAGSLAALARAPRIPLYRRVVWGQPEPVAVTPLGGVVETDRYRFRVVPTPGHAPDHVCLFEEREGWLFSSDLYISPRVRYLRRDENPHVLLDSLRAVLALDARLLLCAHAGFVEDPRTALTRRLGYWEELADKAASLRARGVSDGAITRRLLGREGLMTYISLGEFSRKNLIRGLLATAAAPRPPRTTALAGER